MRALTTSSEKLLSPLPLRSEDRLKLSLAKDAQSFIARIYSEEPTSLYPERIYPASNAASVEFVNRIQERKKIDSTKYPCSWQFAMTDITAATINASWAPPRLQIEDESTQLAFNYLLLGSATQDRGVEIVAQYREQGILPDFGNLLVHPELPLDTCQKVAAHLVGLAEYYALFMEQGTGKTPVMIARICNDALEQYLKTGRQQKIIIVCPRNVRSNWANEFSRFATTKGRIIVMRGDKLNRIKLYVDSLEDLPGDAFTAVIVSYETMVRMIGMFEEIKWDRGILDEAHYIKNPSSKRCQAAMKLRDVCKRRNILTGTPICNNILDLYAQFSFLSPTASGFISWKAFKKFYGVWDKTEDFAGHEKLVAVQNMPFMKERLTRNSYIVRKSEVLDLPPKVYDIREVLMGKEQELAYKNLRDHLVHEIENDLSRVTGANRSLVCTNTLSKLLRLAQITSGFMSLAPEYDEMGAIVSEGEARFFDPNPKLDELITLLNESGKNCKVIVWAHWRNDIFAISKRLKELNQQHVLYFGCTTEKARIDSEYRFNFDRSCRLLLGSAGAGGTGLNLLGHPPGPEGDDYETDCGHVIYYSQDWSHPKRSQSEDRPHRRGTRVQLRVTDLSVPNTIDEEIRARVLGKRTSALEVSDIRQILYSIAHGAIHDDG